MPLDVARVAIDGRKWIASRFHPNLLSEKLIGDITHQLESLQEQHLQALKNILAKRKRRIEKEGSLRQKGSWDSWHQTLDPLNTYQATRAPGPNLSSKVTLRVLRKKC